MTTVQDSVDQEDIYETLYRSLTGLDLNNDCRRARTALILRGSLGLQHLGDCFFTLVVMH